jgi:hypothetical protein
MSRTIADRLIEWEERWERREAVSAQDLCADAPDLAPELARLIGLLESARRVFDVSPMDAITVAVEGAPAAHLPTRLPDHIGRYEVRAELGRGATSVVYLAWDPELRREVALKVLHEAAQPGGLLQATLVARHGREAQTLARLRHDHIVPIYEPGLAEGRPFFVLEYVRGGSLRDRLAELSAAGPRTFVPLLHQVARAVQHAHERGILHRDLKPANVLLAEDRRALVSDFGLAKLLGGPPASEADAAETVPYQESGSADASMRLTATGFQPGTPAYMAPEQYDPSFGPVGPATDVWAMGVILYELLTGQKPFAGRARAEVAAQVCGGQLVRPRQRRPGVDRGLEAIALRCLQTDPSRRYQTAGEFAAALAGWQARRRLPWLLAGAALVASLAAVAAAVWVRERSPERRYQRWEDAQLAALKRNEAVNFIPSGATPSLPYWWVRAGEQGTTVHHTDGGLAIDGEAKCCLVELCREVPLEHYRVRASIRVPKLLTGTAEWGVYVNYNRVNTDPGPQHYFEAVHFVDTAGFPTRPLPKGPRVVQAALSSRLFSYHHITRAPTGDIPYRHARGPHPRGTFIVGRVPEGALGTSWRTIQIDVHAGDVSARCGGEGIAEEMNLGTIRAQDRETWLPGVFMAYPDLRNLEPRMSGTGAGVFVDFGVCDVSEFVIEPLAAP